MKYLKIKFPPPFFIREGFFYWFIFGSQECTCGSSKKGLTKCIQPNCFHYYKGFKSEDYNNNWGYYDEKGNLILEKYYE